MDLNGFLRALGEFALTLAGNSVDALIDLWNGEMMQSLLNAPLTEWGKMSLLVWWWPGVDVIN